MKHHIYNSMIDEHKTFILFRYTSDILKPHSHKKVWKICDVCSEERLVSYRDYSDLCKSCSKIGKNNHMYKKHHTEEAKLKISKANSGKHRSEEMKLKMSVVQSGENNSQWKGGKKLAIARKYAKRRKLFGFIPHNIPHENFHGHHLDFNHVIFIPKELHMSVPHSVVNNKNMNIINDVVCDWYLKFQII